MDLSPLILKQLEIVNRGKFPLEAITGRPKRETISTGSLAFDQILGGGYARGFITELAGFSQMGKTTLTLNSINCFLKEHIGEESWVVYYDAERRLNYTAIEHMGIDRSRMLIVEPKSIEEISKSLDVFLNSDTPPSMVVIDSVDSLMGLKEKDIDITNKAVGGSSGKWTQVINHLRGVIGDSRTAVLLLNHLKPAIGAKDWEDANYRPGGKTIENAAYVIVDFSSRRQLKIKDLLVGWTFLPVTYKHTDRAPRQKAEVNFIFTEVTEAGELVPFYAVDVVPEAVKLGKDFEIFTKADGTPLKSGGRWHYKGEYLASKEEDVEAFLRVNSEILQNLINDIKEKISA